MPWLIPPWDADEHRKARLRGPFEHRLGGVQRPLGMKGEEVELLDLRPGHMGKFGVFRRITWWAIDGFIDLSMVHCDRLMAD